MSIWSPTYQQSVLYLSAVKFIGVFTYKMAVKINWHRYGTKLSHCHRMYLLSSCVRLSVTSGVLSKQLDESSWFFAWKLLFTYCTLCYKQSGVSPKGGVLSSRTSSQTADLENFATGSRSRCQQNSSSTVELVDDTCTTIDESWLFTASRSTVTR